MEEKGKLKSVYLCYPEYQKNVVILDISTALVSENVVRQNFWNIWILDYTWNSLKMSLISYVLHLIFFLITINQRS